MALRPLRRITVYYHGRSFLCATKLPFVDPLSGAYIRKYELELEPRRWETLRKFLDR